MNADFREATLDAHPDSERQGYHKALVDFCIVDLIAQIGVCANTNRLQLEPQEREALAALFVKRLSDNLTEKNVSDYFNTLRYGTEDVLPNPIPIELSPPCHFTPNFAEALTPRFLEGTRVRWIHENREWGVVLGRFYAFAPHLCAWTWRYVVLLDSDSPSADWIVADTAWEDDLEPMEDAA
jgi:hypothetical protein